MSFVCVCTRAECKTVHVSFDLIFQPRGATLAPPELSTHPTLLGLQVKAEYTYSVPYLTHSVRLEIFFYVRFVRLLSSSFITMLVLMCNFFSFCPSELLFFLLRTSKPRCGIACFRPFSCQSITIFHFYQCAFIFFPNISPFSARISTLFFFLPQWRLQHHLTSHCINLQVYF